MKRSSLSTHKDIETDKGGTMNSKGANDGQPLSPGRPSREVSLSSPSPGSVPETEGQGLQLPLKPEKKSLLKTIKKKLSVTPGRKKRRNGDQNVSPDDDLQPEVDTAPAVPMRSKAHSRGTVRPITSPNGALKEKLRGMGTRRTIASPVQAAPGISSTSDSSVPAVDGEKSPKGKLSYVKCANDKADTVPKANGVLVSVSNNSGIRSPGYAQADSLTGAKARSATLPASTSRAPASLPASSMNSTTGQRLSLQIPVAPPPPQWVYQRRFEPVYQELQEPARTWTLTKELFRLSKYGWYWGPLSRAEAEEKLAEQQDGAFLVRDSSDERYLLSLSFRSYGKTLHTRIEHLNGVFSFYALPECEGYNSIVDLIENSVKDSKAGVFCYSRSRSPNGPSFPVRLTTPVSRFTQVRSMQYLCRFVIRQYTRLDHIQKLPLPNSVKSWLEESQF